MDDYKNKLEDMHCSIDMKCNGGHLESHVSFYGDGFYYMFVVAAVIKELGLYKEPCCEEVLMEAITLAHGMDVVDGTEELSAESAGVLN